VSSVEVLGLADAVGAPGANFELSKRRADAVASVLSVNGLPAADYKLAAAGQAGAVATDGTARPLRRRADITLHLSGPR
jgi:outer membrane protein OmpA-like peptidoglycan-associated protein